MVQNGLHWISEPFRLHPSKCVGKPIIISSSVLVAPWDTKASVVKSQSEGATSPLQTSQSPHLPVCSGFLIGLHSYRSGLGTYVPLNFTLTGSPLLHCYPPSTSKDVRAGKPVIPRTKELHLLTNLCCVRERLTSHSSCSNTLIVSLLKGS